MSELSKDQWKALLKATTFFKTFEDDELEKIIDVAGLLHFSMHQYIIKENEVDSSFYVLVKGHANVIKKHTLGQQETLLTINTGECFGEMAIITKQKRKNFILAGIDCYAVKIKGEAIDKMSESIQLKLYKQIAYNLIKRLQR